MICNDITHQIGSFGPEEDAVFQVSDAFKMSKLNWPPWCFYIDWACLTLRSALRNAKVLNGCLCGHVIPMSQSTVGDLRPCRIRN